MIPRLYAKVPAIPLGTAKKIKNAEPEAPKPKKAFPKFEKKAGTAVAKKKSTAVALTKDQKTELTLFTAPDEMKASFYLVAFGTDKDGYFSPSAPCGVERIVGRMDSDKRHNWFAVDPATCTAIMARIAASTAATNPLKRLTPNRMYRLTLRAGPSKDGNVNVGVKMVERGKPSTKKPGTIAWASPLERPEKDSEKEIDPDLKKLIRTARLLRGAFVNVRPLPVKAKKIKDDSTDD